MQARHSAPGQKIRLISCGTMSHVSDIKLIRTDTTLDLSQKAEKGMPELSRMHKVIIEGVVVTSEQLWDLLT